MHRNFVKDPVGSLGVCPLAISLTPVADQKPVSACDRPFHGPNVTNRERRLSFMAVFRTQSEENAIPAGALTYPREKESRTHLHAPEFLQY